jgi:hypothetical protein
MAATVDPPLGRGGVSRETRRQFTKTAPISIGGLKMGQRTPNPESERPDSKPEAGDAATGSAAEQAKEREREMEESGEENAT